MTARRAILRADASPEIGTGHVVRCITLGRALRERGWTVALATENLPAGLRQMAVEAGLDVVGAAYAAASDHPSATLMVVDHYGIDAAWIHKHRSRALIWMAIDDLADRSQPVDVLLDQNLGRDPEEYRDLVTADARLLIGPRYALVRPAFAQRRVTLPARTGRIRRILVFVGGSDRPNVTGRAVAALERLPFEVDVAVGGTYGGSSELRALVGRLPVARLYVDTQAMDELMARADLAIGAPSSASWERCTLGLPCILVAIADNQRVVERALVDVGAATTLGWHSDVTTEDIHAAVVDLARRVDTVRQMAAAAADVTDGLGTNRVVDAIESLLAGGGRTDD